MTTAKELGVTYSPTGQLIQPSGEPIRLNSIGAKHVKGFAMACGYDIIDVQEGWSFPRFSMGVNGAMVMINVPTKEGKICEVPIDIENDFFLPSVKPI